MSRYDFRKTESGVVINTNKSSLIEAKKRKRLLLDKDKKIDDLERRLLVIEQLLLKITEG
jgi:hypothetical protein